jgi:hypothetical protein
MLLNIVAKNLAVSAVHSKKMKETVLEAYCPTDKTVLNSVIQSFYIKSVLSLCPNQALLLENAILCTVGKGGVFL